MDVMCGRYTLVRGDKIKVVFNVTVPADLRLVGRFNVAPTQLVPVITNDSPQLQLMRWGLIPSWTKKAKVRIKTSGDKAIVSLELIPQSSDGVKKSNLIINARAETLTEKPAFRKALAKRRCLVPADGFYEWRKNGDGSKTPMYIRMCNDELFAFAGLWENWEDADGVQVRSLSIITTTPNELMKSIHDRMPVIIPAEGYSHWLATGDLSPEKASRWLKPFPTELMRANPVGPMVNSSKNEGSDLILPATELPIVKRMTKPTGQPSLFD
jgi:putative SOS response-associated peptidase YedK